MSLLKVSQLRKTFDGFVAVDDVSFQVESGESFGLLGPNGAGKSTTMNMIAGLLSPTDGSILLDGQPLTAANRELRTLMGVVPQDLAIYPDMTARENLHFFGRLYGVTGSELKKRIENVLDRIGLTSRAESLVNTYSGGMKRRLNFGIALLHQPRLLILDEPTVGVDPQSRSHLLDCVRELGAEGVATIYASHYMEEVQSLCQRVAILDHGKVLACDELQELLGRMSSDLCLHVSRPPDDLMEPLAQLAELQDSPDDKDTVVLVVSNDQQRDAKTLNTTLMRIVGLIDQNDLQLRSVETREPNLERLFLNLTGHQLRD